MTKLFPERPETPLAKTTGRLDVPLAVFLGPAYLDTKLTQHLRNSIGCRFTRPAQTDIRGRGRLIGGHPNLLKRSAFGFGELECNRRRIDAKRVYMERFAESYSPTLHVSDQIVQWNIHRAKAAKFNLKYRTGHATGSSVQTLHQRVVVEQVAHNNRVEINGL